MKASLRYSRAILRLMRYANRKKAYHLLLPISFLPLFSTISFSQNADDYYVIKGEPRWSASIAAQSEENPAVQTIDEGVTLESTSTFHVKIGPPAAGAIYPTPYDISIVNGDVVLDGRLEIKLLEGSSTFVGLGHPLHIISTRLLGEHVPLTDPETGEFVFMPSITGDARGTITGHFSNMDEDGRVMTSDGEGSFLVTIEDSMVTLSDFVASEEDVMSPEEGMSDTDGDGNSLAMEWIFGSDPEKADVIKPLVGNGVISASALESLYPYYLMGEETADFQTFSFRVRKEKKGIQIEPQASADLNFSEDSILMALEIGTEDDGEFEIVTYAIGDINNWENPELSAPSKGFMRIHLNLYPLPPVVGPGDPPVIPPIITPPPTPWPDETGFD